MVEELCRLLPSPDPADGGAHLGAQLRGAVLDALVSYGTFDPAWVAPFDRWYAAETDLRGNDPELGWLHAVAHGADLLGTLGLRPEVDPVGMLDLASRRLIAQTDTGWQDGEDERLGHAMALTLTRHELSESASIGWVHAVEDSWTGFSQRCAASRRTCGDAGSRADNARPDRWSRAHRWRAVRMPNLCLDAVAGES